MTKKVQKSMNGGRALGIVFGFMIIVFLLVSCAAAAQPAGTESYHGKDVAANEVLVKFHTATPAEIYKVKVKEDVDEAEPVGSTGAMRLHSKSKNVETLISDLSGNPNVEYAEPDYVVYATKIPNDPYFTSLWGLTKISAPSAWDLSTGSPTNIAGVIDTGIDYTHPDLAANVWSAPTQYTVKIGSNTITCPVGSHGFSAISNTCDPMDDNNHGTHVSGTIGGVGNNGAGVAGVNWNTKIIGAKFLDSKGSGYTSDAVNAIDFLIQTKKMFGSDANIRVLSNSWSGGGYSQALLDEINKANTNGMLFVAAAGNDGKNNDIIPSYPASYNAPNVVAVAATDSTDTLASWSNYGKTSVDLAAPGVSILSTVRGGYAYYSGTSMATPHVSGAALLILSGCDLTTDQLKTNILTNVDPVPSLATKTVTGGRLNVNNAIRDCSAVPKTSTVTTLSALPTSSTFGESVTFTATVIPTGGSGTPTGTVTFYDGGSSLSSGTLNSGMAGITTSALSAGVHSITATYEGDSVYSGSTSPTLQYTVYSATAGDFSLSASPISRSVNPGSGTSYIVSITRSSGFTEAITFSLSGLPSGASGTFKPVTTTGTSTKLSITTSSTTPPGTYLLTITGTSKSQISNSTKVTLIVKPPRTR